MFDKFQRIDISSIIIQEIYAGSGPKWPIASFQQVPSNPMPKG